MNGTVRLADWGLIRAEGPDAAAFLHGQLTQDVQNLPPDAARLAGYCSAKGRLLASFVVWREAPDALLLALSADLLPATLKRLSMFVLRTKCKLTDASADRPIWGIAGAAAEPVPKGGVWRSDGATWVRLPDAVPAAGQAVARALWVGADAAAAPALAPSGAARLTAADWAALEVASGVPRITAATADHFVPQMVNLELVGGVNFQKGCYPGQEVVARSQYRGTLKRRLHRLALDAPTGTPWPVGSEVFHSADPGQPAGEVVLSAARADAATEALVELKLAAMAGGSLHAGAPDGPALLPLTLPYAITSVTE